MHHAGLTDPGVAVDTEEAQLLLDVPRAVRALASFERTILAVMVVAAMERAVMLTVDYVSERRAFGKTLMELQNTRFKLAECQTTATVARVFINDCVQRLCNRTLDSATASMAKWWGSQMQCDVIDECLQLFGGYGYMREYPIAQMYADARVQKIYGGANEIMKELIARSLRPTGS